MTTLYIANCTKQPHEFTYRVPVEDGEGLTRRVQVQRIDPGTQQRIHNETAMIVLEMIVDQHIKYGLKPVAEVVRTKDFVGLCYSFDKPVNLDRLGYTFDHNEGVQQEISEERREEVALAIDRGIFEQTEEARRMGMPLAPLRGVDVVTMEDSDNPQYSKALRIDHGIPREDGRVLPTKSPRTAKRVGRRGGAQ
jgi:hypothetical protein